MKTKKSPFHFFLGFSLWLFMGSIPMETAQAGLADDFVLKITTTAPNENFTFYTQDVSYDIDWEDNNGTFEDVGVSGNQTHNFAVAGDHIIRFQNLNDVYINNQDDGRKYTSIEQWGTSAWNGDMSHAFHGAYNLIGNYSDVPNMSQVNNMAYMFSGGASVFAVRGDIREYIHTSKFNQPLNSWNVSKVTNMNGMFEGASSFNQPLNSWNVSKVTNMNGMFAGASSFNQPLDSWNVSKVTNMGDMFTEAASFNQPLNSWNMSKVGVIDRMFTRASSFNQPLNSWDVSKVTNMNNMFWSASSFNQPLNSWNVSNVTDMSGMFDEA